MAKQTITYSKTTTNSTVMAHKKRAKQKTKSIFSPKSKSTKTTAKKKSKSKR